MYIGYTYRICTYIYCAHFRVLPNFCVVKVFHIIIPRCNMKVNSFPTRAISHAVHVERIYILPHSKPFCNKRLVSIQVRISRPCVAFVRTMITKTRLLTVRFCLFYDKTCSLFIQFSRYGNCCNFKENI